MDQDEVFDRITHLVLEQLTPELIEKEEGFYSFTLSDLARSHQKANFDLVLNKIESLGGFNSISSPKNMT